MHDSVSQVLVTIYWLGKAANSCASYSGTTLNLKEFEGLLAQMRKVTWLFFLIPWALDKVGKQHVCLLSRSLQVRVMKSHRPEMSCAQGSDRLSYPRQLCLLYPTPTWNFIPFWEWEGLSLYNFNSQRTNSVSQYMTLGAKELSACFLGEIMPEWNNTVLYKNEDSLCTLILKVILLTCQGLGMGEVTLAKFLPWSLKN